MQTKSCGPALVIVLLLTSFVLLAGEAEPKPPAREEVVEKPDPLERAFADPPATGMLVLRVVTGGQSEQIGIEAGDVLVSYDGKPTPGIEALNEAKAGAEGKESVPLVFVRGGNKIVFEFAPGSLGVYLHPVKEGEPVPPLPPATEVAFDFSSLRKNPRDWWYEISLDGEGKVGFEHRNLSFDEEGQLLLRRELAFDGGDEVGVNHLLLSIVATADARPLLLRTRVVTPRSGNTAEGTRRELEDGTTEWRLTWRNARTDKTGERSFPARRDLVPDFFVDSLVSFMPRAKGACFHFRPISEYDAHVAPPAAILCTGKVEIEFRGETVTAWLFEQHRLPGGVTARYHVDDAGQVLRAEFGGPKTILGERAAVLEGIPEHLRPRGVK